jgi:uncharacterized membrane protein YjgN (DUF898 family)
MNRITVTCPGCSCRQEIAAEQLPARPVFATCRRCGEHFPFSGHLPAPAAATMDDFINHRFTFKGDAREYFGIWIVNLLLTVVTFGLYSAWAKVRKKRYLYGNTLLGDAPFDYTAEPLTIFKGWCIAAALLTIYSLGSSFHPLLGGLFGLLFYLAVPWLIVRSRLFTLRNSVHRHIRFTFRPDYQEAYLVYAALPLLILPTLGLIMPYLLYRQKKFMAEMSGYGNLTFNFSATARNFYRFFAKVALGIGVIAGSGTLAALLLAPAAGAGVVAFVPLMILGIFALYFFVVIYVQTGLANLTWNATGLGAGLFISSLRSRDMAWLYLSNAVAIAGSFGLMVPWATVRMARYRCERLEFSAPADLRTLAVEQGEISAGGEEIGDLFGVEVGF